MVINGIMSFRNMQTMNINNIVNMMVLQKVYDNGLLAIDHFDNFRVGIISVGTY